jgi:phosphate:Na+ symporter
MLWVSQSLLGNADEVFVLVMFQTLVNVVSLVLFFPILHPFANWLERTVKGDSLRKSLHLSTHPPSDPELAVELFRTESGAFLQAACAVNLSALRIQSDESLLQLGMDEDHPLVRSLTTHGSLPYEYMKAWQGELQLYYLALRKTGQASHQAEEAERIASAVRNAMHALKSMHDIRENLHELRESTSQVKHDAYKHIRDSAKELFDACLLHLKESKHTDQAALVSLYERINRQYEVALAHFYDEAANASIDSRAFTAVMNLNREMYAAKKAMLFAIRDFLMAPGAGAGFDDLMSLKP